MIFITLVNNNSQVTKENMETARHNLLSLDLTSVHTLLETYLKPSSNCWQKMHGLLCFLFILDFYYLTALLRCNLYTKIHVFNVYSLSLDIMHIPVEPSPQSTTKYFISFKSVLLHLSPTFFVVNTLNMRSTLLIHF